MNYPPPFLFVNKSCDEAVSEVVQQLVAANLQVLRTFDLGMTRTSFTQCTCPNHGTEQCDCQFVVLLVYRDKLPPTSLIAHGHDGKTWFALVDSPEQRAATRLIATIRQALVPPEDSQSGKINCTRSDLAFTHDKSNFSGEVENEQNQGF